MSGLPSNSRVPYNKQWLSHADQLSKLVARGLVVADPAAAEEFLSHINYYRLSGYCLAFEQHRHKFSAGCSFEHVRYAYEFDMVLRDLVTEALEVLEVDFRSAIAYQFGRLHGAFGHVDSAKFFSNFKHGDWLSRLQEEAERSSELFVTHFRSNYDQFPNLPIWMAMEVMSFGALSKMYQGMHRLDQKPIAHRYGVQSIDLVAIFHHLVYVRNLCAHHSRLWDRVWAIKPSLPKGKAWQPPMLRSNDRLFATLLLLFHLMRRCSAVQDFAEKWRDRLIQHLKSPPSAVNPFDKMGMPSDWDKHPVWK